MNHNGFKKTLYSQNSQICTRAKSFISSDLESLIVPKQTVGYATTSPVDGHFVPITFWDDSQSLDGCAAATNEVASREVVSSNQSLIPQFNSLKEKRKQKRKTALELDPYFDVRAF